MRPKGFRTIAGKRRYGYLSALEPDAAEAATLDASGWSVSDWPPIGSALEPDAGHPSDGGESPPADVGDPEHRSDARSNRLASGSSALEEGGWPSPCGPSGMVKTVSRVTYGTAEDLDSSSPPSSSASEGCQPQCGPNSPLGGRARTSEEVRAQGRGSGESTVRARSGFNSPSATPARTPGDVAEEAWRIVNASYFAGVLMMRELGIPWEEIEKP